MAQLVELLQVQVGVVQELSKGSAMLPLVNNVLDGPNAPILSLDAIVLQLQLQGAQLAGCMPEGLVVRGIVDRMD